ncbi:sialate O-acetylesterase [Pseudopedobacter beijingensis]|uniref:Sialate O-acetylesterase n=1 Tax=Pseudopedobacter beijingensis TaxID=1207056 RepID=A0ABW4IHM4_9SPHI
MLGNYFRRSILLLLFAAPQFLQAKIVLPALVGDGMVLQRDVVVPVWGWANPGEAVQILFKGKFYETKADPKGYWKLHLDKQTAATALQMVVKGEKDEITIGNIAIGDVWVCSGQSNMYMKIKDLGDAYTLKPDDNIPQIRSIEVAKVTSFKPEENFKSIGWREATPMHLPAFSAVAYFFAKELYQKNQVPIGLISTSWGGTKAEAWVSLEGLKELPHYISRYNNVKEPAFRESILQKEKDDITSWSNQVRVLDKGFQSPKTWNTPGFDDSSWKRMILPAYWEKQPELRNYDGVVWFRKEVELTKADLGKRSTLFLSYIDELDSTYVNGKLVGATYGRNNIRKYAVSEDLLVEGKNVITVRVTDWGGPGGFSNGPDGMKIVVGERLINLNNEWAYKESLPLKDMPKYPRTDKIVLQYEPSLLYNAMISPLTNYAIKGVIWYQGESNTDKAEEYSKLLPALIKDWRSVWKQGDFPFLYVQLPNYGAYSLNVQESNWASLREAQLKTLSVPNTGMVVTIDVGEEKDLHPKNKWEIGKRLAIAAQKVAYGNNKIVFSGPVYKEMKVTGAEARITFDHIGSGLVSRDSNILQGFFIAGEDGLFKQANARIEKNQVIVWHNTVTKPVAVRYAWQDNPYKSNLINKEGLPASPFRTDKP